MGSGTGYQALLVETFRGHEWVQGYLGCREGPCVVADLSVASGTSRNCVTGTRLLGPTDLKVTLDPLLLSLCS